MMGPPRTFDHDECRELRRHGWTYKSLMERYGVSRSRIDQICNPHTALIVAASRARRQTSGTCPDCGIPTSFNVSRKRLLETDGSARCRHCAARHRVVPTVRPATLRCCTCTRWLPDENFPLQAARVARRGRHHECRDCQTLSRRYRRQQKKAS